MIPLCEEEGLGVIPWSPLARGLLAGSRQSIADRKATVRAGSDSHAHSLYTDPGDWAIVEAVEKVAAARGVSPAEVALAWLLGKPGVTAPIVGATKLAHLDAAIRAVELKLSDDEVSALEAPYRPHEVTQ
jgi:aryl-alcohol dehydrogenase-like predicted oxidoreductase